MFSIFTDGSCLGNPGPGGYACIIRDAQDNETIHSGGEVDTTNNRMELMAAITALETLPPKSKVHLFTDSNYVVKGMTEWIEGWKAKGWKNSQKKPVSNRDLWEALDKVARKHTIRWEWVKAHAGHPENERCDQLAKQEAEIIQSKT